MVRPSYASRLDKPLRPNGAVKNGRDINKGGLSLQSLQIMSHGSTRSARGGEAMRVEAIDPA
jgi:hypothetical protein